MNYIESFNHYSYWFPGWGEHSTLGVTGVLGQEFKTRSNGENETILANFSGMIQIWTNFLTKISNKIEILMKFYQKKKDIQ